jgi:hypothetical protein
MGGGGGGKSVTRTPVINLCFPFVVTSSISYIYPFISLFVPGGSCHGGNHMIVGFASTLKQANSVLHHKSLIF